MAHGGVGEPCDGQPLLQCGGEVNTGGEVVDVEGDQAAGEDVAFSPPASLEVSTDESSDVFDLVFLRLRQLFVFVVGDVDGFGS